MIEYYSSKFPDGSSFLVLKSLTYFEDADAQVMPEMFESVSWSAVKDSIIRAQKEYVANL
jgi:hypothetical protein